MLYKTSSTHSAPNYSLHHTMRIRPCSGVPVKTSCCQSSEGQPSYLKMASSFAMRRTPAFRPAPYEILRQLSPISSIASLARKRPSYVYRHRLFIAVQAPSSSLPALRLAASGSRLCTADNEHTLDLPFPPPSLLHILGRRDRSREMCS